VLFLPTMREPAPLITETIDETHRRPPSNTAAFNRLGLPALTLPCGFSSQNLPVGLEVVGPYFGEQVALNVAFAYQSASEWHEKHLS
jgi:aspartyl-tRNA(Asn)/glutamyl-tRNA(Gln) amidotransferase subunit A